MTTTENKHPRTVSRASNSFRAEEVEAMCNLLSTLYKGGDTDVILRSDPMRRVAMKFTRMRENIAQAQRDVRQAAE
jgi:hypothetical protein